VVKRLAGDGVSVLALRDYFVEGLSPSDICRRYGVRPTVLRGWISRAYEKFYRPSPSAQRAIAYVLGSCWGYVLRVDPIVVHGNGRSFCLVCGRVLNSKDVIAHVTRKHEDLIKQVLDSVLREMNNGIEVLLY
jgi:hypothetical protein